MKNFEQLSEQQQNEDIRTLQAKINRIEQDIEGNELAIKPNWGLIKELEKRKERKRAELQEKNRVHYLRTGDDILAASGEQGVKGAGILPCPSGTKWKDILIQAIDESHIKIKTPNGEKSYHFGQLDMADRRTQTKPVNMWVLLQRFCRHSGRIGAGDKIESKNLRQDISNLNKKMKAIFEIPEAFTKPYKKREGWVAKCHCSGFDYNGPPIERPEDYDSISNEAILRDINGDSFEDE